QFFFFALFSLVLYSNAQLVLTTCARMNDGPIGSKFRLHGVVQCKGDLGMLHFCFNLDRKLDNYNVLPIARHTSRLVRRKLLISFNSQAQLNLKCELWLQQVQVRRRQTLLHVWEMCQWRWSLPSHSWVTGTAVG
ncbi:hypothetical protein PMAYCL1PPCAC_32317, partial [Pristionchus mayeri]